jgi:hypothetical protein
MLFMFLCKVLCASYKGLTTFSYSFKTLHVKCTSIIVIK